MKYVVTRVLKGDAVVGLAALVLAGVYAFFASGIPRSFLADPVGAAGLPEGYAIALALLASLLVVQSLTSHAPRRETVESGSDRMGASRHLRAIGLLLPGIAYLLLISSLGYLVTTLLLILAVALYAGARPDLKLLSVSVAGALAMWVIFDRLFNIPLPVGSLWQGLFH
jgi:hypothetical protein